MNMGKIQYFSEYLTINKDYFFIMFYLLSIAFNIIGVFYSL